MSLSSVSSFSWSVFALTVKCQIKSLVETSPDLGSVPDPCSSLSKGFGIRLGVPQSVWSSMRPHLLSVCPVASHEGMAVSTPIRLIHVLGTSLVVKGEGNRELSWV